MSRKKSSWKPGFQESTGQRKGLGLFPFKDMFVLKFTRPILPEDFTKGGTVIDRGMVFFRNKNVLVSLIWIRKEALRTLLKFLRQLEKEGKLTG